MSGDDFAKWLAARLQGSPSATAPASWATTASEYVNGAMRPAVVVGWWWPL